MPIEAGSADQPSIRAEGDHQYLARVFDGRSDLVTGSGIAQTQVAVVAAGGDGSPVWRFGQRPAILLVRYPPALVTGGTVPSLDHLRTPGEEGFSIVAEDDGAAPR